MLFAVDMHSHYFSSYSQPIHWDKDKNNKKRMKEHIHQENTIIIK